MANKSIKFNKPIINKNSYVGRTYKVNDNDLPHKDKDSNKIVNLAVIEENGKKVGGVRTTTKKGLNSTPFNKSKHILYKGYKNFLETNFQNGDIIRVDDKRLCENPWKYNLSYENVNEIKNKIYYNSHQSIENRKKRELFNFKNKKK